MVTVMAVIQGGRRYFFDHTENMITFFLPALDFFRVGLIFI